MSSPTLEHHPHGGHAGAKWLVTVKNTRHWFFDEARARAFFHRLCRPLRAVA